MRHRSAPVLLTALLLVPASAGWAQGAKGGPFRRFTPLSASALASASGLSLLQLPRSLEARLQLTAEQKKQLEAIRRKLQQDLRTAGTPGAAVTGGAQYQAAAAARTGAAADAQEVLERHQRKQFYMMQVDYQQYEPLGRPAMALLAVDGLTDDQKAGLKALVRDTESRRQEALRSLAQTNDPAARAQAAAVASRNAEAGARRLLTAEQQKQFDVALRELPGG